MISEILLDYKMRLPGSDHDICNRFLYHAENSYKFLKDVNDGKIEMFSDAYSILANTMERMFKGVAIELQKLYPNQNIVCEDINISHSFKKYAQSINRIIPIAKNKEGYYVTLDNIDRISLGYTDAKFYSMYELSDFQKDFKRLEIYRDRLYKGLDRELTAVRYADIKNIEEAEIPYEDLDLM